MIDLETRPKASARSNLRHVCVGTITRGRPMMLQRLLRSYARMQVPDGVRLHFLIVENTDTPTLHDVVDRFAAEVPDCLVQYEIEPRLGIAAARNRVLDLALDAGADLLTFADDDEIVERGWLQHLLAEHDTGLDIVGSPVRVALPETRVSFWGKLIWRGLDQANRRCEARASLRRQRGEGHKVLISTGSWMGNLDFFRSTNLRFDDKLALSGGEDGTLWAEAKRLGARSGWSPGAIVYETICPERLSLTYRYRRSRDEAISKMRARIRDNKASTLRRLPGSLLARVTSLAVVVAATPVTPARSLVRAAWHVGSIAGILQALAGRDSAHYSSVTGS